MLKILLVGSVSASFSICNYAFAEPLQANQAHSYSVKIIAPDNIKSLITTHLELIDKLNNPRMSVSEWQRLLNKSHADIKGLLATEGYFSPKISQSINGDLAQFTVLSGQPALIRQVNISFSGDIVTSNAAVPNAQSLKSLWSLKQNMPFKQATWADAKRQLLTALIIKRYPQANIQSSSAIVNPETNLVDLSVKFDSGASHTFGEVNIIGLARYPQKIIRNLNKIKPGDEYSQVALLDYQAELQATNQFLSVEVSADTENEADLASGTAVTNGLASEYESDPAKNQQQIKTKTANIIVKVVERKSQTLALGLGASTNTGGRVQLKYTDRNLFGKGWFWDTTTKIEQRAQSIDSEITLPTSKRGYRDSINNNVVRLNVEGQTTTAFNNGIKRSWGNKKLEQYVGINSLFEYLKVDGEDTQFNKSVTLAYGILLRRVDSELFPTKGFLVNLQFQAAPFDQLSDGKFLQSYVRTQAYYPITKSTQLITRLEAGMVSGSQSVPATYLFRTGGDQSVRGYAFQSLGVNNGDAIIGGRVLMTGSVEVIQWLSTNWGGAAFVDFGNAASKWQDYKPAYGYGLGARWKSPAGPVGLDIAYGESTGKYRLHFNLGVVF